MNKDDIIRALEEILDSMEESNWSTAKKDTIDLYDELTQTPADIREENGGFWF